MTFWKLYILHKYISKQIFERICLLRLAQYGRSAVDGHRKSCDANVLTETLLSSTSRDLIRLRKAVVCLPCTLKSSESRQDHWAAGLRGITRLRNTQFGKTHTSRDKPHKHTCCANEEEGLAPLPRSSCQDAVESSWVEQMNMDQRLKYIFKMLEMSILQPLSAAVGVSKPICWKTNVSFSARK